MDAVRQLGEAARAASVSLSEIAVVLATSFRHGFRADTAIQDIQERLEEIRQQQEAVLSCSLGHNDALVMSQEQWEAARLLFPTLLEDMLRREEVQRQKELANERARTLLMSYLDNHQLTVFNRTGSVPRVIGNVTGDYYTIEGRWIGNIIRVSDGQRFCIQIQMNSPIYDQMLSQLLMITTEESEFLSVANRVPSYWT